MEVAVEFVVLGQVELPDHLVMEFPGIEDGPDRIGVLVAAGKAQEGAHAAGGAAQHGAEPAQGGLCRGGRGDDGSGRVGGLEHPHDQDKDNDGRERHQEQPELQVLQVVVQETEADFDKADGFLLVHKKLDATCSSCR